MRILALDTATKSCSVAVANGEVLLAEITINSNQTHSKHVMTSVDRVLHMAQQRVHDLHGFSVTKGPGSFTGLRIGISVTKGLAIAYCKPVIGVSTLDVLASQAGEVSTLICPVIDARRQEVYFSLYRFKDGMLTRETAAQVLPIEKAILQIKEPCMFIGEGAVVYRKSILETLGSAARFAPQYQHIIRASTVASLSIERFLKQDIDEVETFGPLYIRKSDAELNSNSR
jgi:tRNA threonylcarbamoyladenosine biosynthesis protein TsaB